MTCTVDQCVKGAERRGMCQMHWWRLQHHGDVHWYGYQKDCDVDGCDRPHCKNGHCSLHNARLQRTGTTNAPVRRPLARKRYRQVKVPGHPLANPETGRVYLHRVVLHDLMEIGARHVPCYWCGTALRWTRTLVVPADGIVVDHLDHDRHNNDLTNLVPACGPCNSARSWWSTTPFAPQYEAA